MLQSVQLQNNRVFLRLVAVIFLVLPILASCAKTGRNIQQGASAPDFSLQAVRGGSYQLTDLAGKVVILSFINTQAQATSDTADPSRAQIVFLKSMQVQYGAKGTVVLIVDAARVATGKYPGQDNLINFTYDWQLDTIPVLDDTRGKVAKSYGVESTPVTFLIGSDRIIQQRWDGFASASQLALALEALVGPPIQRQADSGQTAPSPPTTLCVNEARPQARFAGVGLARPLSDELWVVDGGQPWGTGAAFPLQWILLDTLNITQQTPLHIQVVGQYTNNQQVILLVDQPMELLAPDVASGLLSGDATPPAVYSLVTSVFLENPGCMEIRTVVTREGTTILLYQGILIVPIK